MATAESAPGGMNRQNAKTPEEGRGWGLRSTADHFVGKSIRVQLRKGTRHGFGVTRSIRVPAFAQSDQGTAPESKPRMALGTSSVGRGLCNRARRRTARTPTSLLSLFWRFGVLAVKSGSRPRGHATQSELRCWIASALLSVEFTAQPFCGSSKRGRRRVTRDLTAPKASRVLVNADASVTSEGQCFSRSNPGCEPSPGSWRGLAVRCEPSRPGKPMSTSFSKMNCSRESYGAA